jgi:hypothetical protein
VSSEIFRFITLRSAQIQSSKDSRIIKIALDSLESDNSFIQNLKRAKIAGSRDMMAKLAKEYIASVDFVNSPKSIDEKYVRFAASIREYADQPIKSYVQLNYDKIFSEEARSLVLSPEFKKTYERITNSLIASIITFDVLDPTKSFIVSALYALFLISQLATNSHTDARIIDAKIVLPNEIFPLPEIDQSLAEHRKKVQERRKKITEETRKKIDAVTRTLSDNDKAIKEIIGTFEKIELNGDFSRKRGFVLSGEAIDRMSEVSKEVLKNQGFVNGEVDVAKSVTVIEKSSAAAASELYSHMNQGTTMVRIGSVLLPDYAISPDILDSDPSSERLTLGICPPVNIDDHAIEDGTVTVPQANAGKRRPLVAELMLVEQKLSRYEMGEIAHIENVLKSEMRERKFRTSKTREESLMVETEETEEKENDLATTDRYELQNETQSVINETANQQAGATISYDGPTVDATANYNYAGSNSSQESHRVSSSYARETTARASSRIENRKLQRRFTRTVEEIEEINKHQFDNTKGPDHISGVYRWVDKIYEAQVVNYGKRMMLEFLVPEPASFLRYAAAQMPSGEATNIVRPDPPGSCLSDGKTFQPLRVEDIRPDTYLFWVAKYNVEDISPPPSNVIIASTSIVNKGGEGEMKQVKYQDPDNNAETQIITFFGHITTTTVPPPIDTWAGASEKGVAIPDGYHPHQAYINLKGLQSFSKAELTVQIQDKEVSNKTIGGGALIELPKSKTPSIPVTVESFGFVLYEVIVNIFCILSYEKLQEWQLATYGAIMNSYNDKKSRYDAAIETAKIRAGYNQIQGKNPLLNREMEKIELKKGCISLLTGQRFNEFDAVNSNVAPHGFPEIDFEEAKVEGDYIKFFEQALEWTNMTYLFYPYFWSNKKEWVMLSKLDDPDLLYTRFLQAGSARVAVPVRVGFDRAICSFLSGAQVWTAEGEFIIDDKIDAEYLSIAEEFRNQSSNYSVTGKGTLNVAKDSTTVEGIGTEFSDINDENRQIIIKGRTYVIKKVQSNTNIILTSKYLGESDSGVEYARGGVLVGQPWEIRLPTNLVKLDPNGTSLLL